MKYFLTLTVALVLFSAEVYTQSLSNSISSAPPILISTSTSLTTISVPAPTSPAKIYVTDPTCATSKGSYFINKFGAEFSIDCPVVSGKEKRVDILSAYINRFADCINVCDPGTQCLGLLFNSTTLGCAGYKCQPAPLNNQWAADMTAKGGTAIDATSCGENQDNQILFNVENAYLNQGAGSVPVNTPRPGTTATPPTAPSPAPPTNSTATISQISASISASYTPAVVQTNAASPIVLSKLFAGVVAVFPLLGF